MMFEQVAKYLESLFPELIIGKTLFVNYMPPIAPMGFLLKDSYGGLEIDGEMPGLHRGRFHMAARDVAENYPQMQALVRKVSEAMTLKEKEFEGVTIRTMRPLHEPIGFQFSDGNNCEFSVNFSTVYVIVA